MTGWLLALLLSLFTGQQVHAFYNPTTGRWLNRDPIGEPGFEMQRGKKASAIAGGPNRHLFVKNSPIAQWDYLGLDNPGCDIPYFDSTPGGALRDCLLRCCAQHDHCFFTRNGREPNGNRPCRSSSWFMVWNPCSPCGGCNRQALGCFAACLSGGGPQEGDRWFCPNGPNRGTFYDNYDDVPDSCWERGARP